MKEMLNRAHFILPPSSFILPQTPSLTVGLPPQTREASARGTDILAARGRSATTPRETACRAPPRGRFAVGDSREPQKQAAARLRRARLRAARLGERHQLPERLERRRRAAARARRRELGA